MLLLVIDMQEDFFRHPRLVEQRAGLVDRTRRLCASFRRHRHPIVWVRQEFEPDLSDATLEVRR